MPRCLDRHTAVYLVILVLCEEESSLMTLVKLALPSLGSRAHTPGKLAMSSCM